MSSGFFAILSRMKYVDRWSLMRNIRQENLMEHSYEVAVIAQALAHIGKRIYHREVDPNSVCAAALYHDCPEIITGDLPTPVKYKNVQIQSAYKAIEQATASRLVSMLPAELQADYNQLFAVESGSLEGRYIKAADKLSAYFKCMGEGQGGNRDFDSAQAQLKDLITAMKMEEVDYFMEHFAPHYGDNLDNLIKNY